MIQKIEKIFLETLKEYELSNIRIIISNRIDLCDFQCDDLFRLSKVFNKNPMELGEEFVNTLNSLEDFSTYFKKIELVKPGFINITVSDNFINEELSKVKTDINYGLNKSNETYVVDFGGANVAKPLHVGHMRSAIVGESIRRIVSYMGNKVISDTHLGDYGLQIGQVIYGIKKYNISLDSIDIKFLDKIYPEMSALCKIDESIKEECANIVKELQEGNVEYKKYFDVILKVSVPDIKKNYDYLSACFDYYYGESDAFNYIKYLIPLVSNHLVDSEGAKIIDVKLESDKKPMPPLVFQKSNGAYLYSTADLAAIYQRKQDFNPDHILYVVDNRQELHFEQVFRTSDKINLFNYNNLEFLGFGTVNGIDGKPYKTRNGDNPKLESLFVKAKEIFVSKKETNKEMSEEDLDIIVNSIIKFADLINFRKKDYIFDLNKFSEVTGKTGPYILYTYLRIDKITDKIEHNLSNNIYNKFDRDLRMKILNFASKLNMAYIERKPNILAEYVYDLSVVCNIFYQNNHLANEEQDKKNDYMYILSLTLDIIKQSCNLLAIDIPSKM